MRVLFLGSPEFALPSLEAVAARHEIPLVLTQPDRPAGRGRRLQSPPVAVRARALGLGVLQPERLRDVRAILESAAADVAATVAYGKILPRWFLGLPRHGCINLHPSLLPRYRGASPIQQAILHGDAVTGVTSIRQTEALDAGEILLQRSSPIAPDETAGTLEMRLAIEGAAALVDVLDALAAGTLVSSPQDEAQASYFGKLAKEDGELNWTLDAAALARQVRAMDPWPGAWFRRGGDAVRVWRARALEPHTATPTAEAADTPAMTSATASPGVVLRASLDGITVATGSGALEILEVQPAGGRRMPAADYARGRPWKPGASIADP
ncbi:MAG: methionyl-tRNA formyltransferase [Armatimonadetes bacterium]|nr:methionyl-tRNA formyltransferase [Armatimonadota bacterium]